MHQISVLHYDQAVNSQRCPVRKGHTPCDLRDTRYTFTTEESVILTTQYTYHNSHSFPVLPESP